MFSFSCAGVAAESVEKRLRTNLLLAIAVAALGLLVWFAPGDEQQEETYALLGADEAVSEIRVLHAAQLQFELRRQQEGWRVIEPVNLPADTFQVDALLALLRQATTRRYAAADADLQQLGLVDPEWTLEIDGEQVLVGGSAAIGNQRYVMKDDFIYLLDEVFSYHLQRSPWDYAGKRILPEGRLVALSLPGGIRVERDGPGWKVVPDDASRTSDELQRVVTAWENATAIRVTPAASVPRDGEVQARFADGRELQFGVELRDNELLLSRDAPAVTYVLPLASADDLFMHVDAIE